MWDEDEAGDGYAAPGRAIGSLRYREDGFTPEKQKIFLKALRKTGCVADAARKARVSRTTVARVRRVFGDFNERCEAARRMAVPALEAIAYRRATVGAPAKIIRKGALVEVRIQPSDAMLRLLLAGAAPEKYGRFAGLAGRKPAAKGAAPDGNAARWQRPRTLDEMRSSIIAKFDAIERHEAAHEGHSFGPGGVLVPPGWRMVSEDELARLGWTPPAGEAARDGDDPD